MSSNMYKRGDSDKRPWGHWEVLDTGAEFVVKRILVKPDNILSLQLHHHRFEHWVIVSGTARVTLGEKEFDVKANEHIYIPVETKHRIANISDAPMEFIEVQTGKILDENDIVRFEDNYGRV